MKQDKDENFLIALIRAILEMFKKNNENRLLGFEEGKLPKMDNPTEQFILNAKNDVLSQIDTFVSENKDELREHIDNKNTKGVSDLVRNNLIPNINIHLASIDVPTDVLSDPNRRIPAYQDEVFDNVKDEFNGTHGENLGEIEKQVEGTLTNKLNEPNMSHHEDLGISPRDEYVVTISEETRLEMMREAGDPKIKNEGNASVDDLDQSGPKQ